MSTQHLCAAGSDSRIQFEGKWTTLDVAELGIVGATCSQVMAPIEGSNNTGVDVHFNGMCTPNRSERVLTIVPGSTISVFGAYVLSPDGDIPLFFTALDNSSVSAPIPLDDNLNGTVSSIYSSPSLSLDAHELGFLVTLLPGTAFYIDTVTITMGADERLQGGGSGSNVPIGPIVGGIVGGIVVIVCSILAFYYLYWQKRHTGRPTDGTSRDLGINILLKYYNMLTGIRERTREVGASSFNRVSKHDCAFHITQSCNKCSTSTSGCARVGERG